jgi:hypothetical protein
MRTQAIAGHAAHSTSHYFLIVALLMAGLTLVVPRAAAAQADSRPVEKTKALDFNVSCQEMPLDPAARCDARANDDRQIPSFDIWCLEIQLYQAPRCDARGGNDMQSYEHYRSLAEQFEQQRGAQQERDQELMNRLNRDPLNHYQMDIVP